jgi:hypothetical protein
MIAFLMIRPIRILKNLLELTLIFANIVINLSGKMY